MKCFIKNAWSLIRCRNESTMRFWVLTFESRLVSDMIQTNMLHQTFLFVKSVQILIFALKYRCIIMRKIQNYEWIVHAIDSNNNILFNFKTICWDQAFLIKHFIWSDFETRLVFYWHANTFEQCVFEMISKRFRDILNVGLNSSYRCIIMRKIQNYEWIVHAIDSNNNILFNFKTICLMYFWCYRRRQPYAIINIFSMVRKLLIID
jgi:hypothetical protein